jgi:hypothetical protein
MIQKPEERYFRYDAGDPWLWMPSRWVREGTVFPAEGDRFYKLVREGLDGWWCGSVEPRQVGSAAVVARIKDLRLRCQVAAAALAEARARPPDAEGQSGPGPTRVEVDNLRNELIQLCNPRAAKVRETNPDPEAGRKLLLATLAVGFGLALVTAVGMMVSFESHVRRQGFGLLGLGLGVLVVLTALLIAVPVLARRYPARVRAIARKFTPSANVLGCIGLVTLALIAAVIVWLVIAFRMASPGPPG